MASKRAHDAWNKATRREQAAYGRKLLQAANEVGKVVSRYKVHKKDTKQEIKAKAAEIESALSRLATALRPWARRAGLMMMEHVVDATAATWRKNSEAIGRGLRDEVATSVMGKRFTKRLEDCAARPTLRAQT